MVLDTKRIKIKSCSAKCQRVLLPRLQSATAQTLYLMASVHGTDEADTEMLVLGFTEAFWRIPLRPQERRFFTAMPIRDGLKQFLIFLRMVQGSR